MTKAYCKPDPLESDPIVKAWYEIGAEEHTANLLRANKEAKRAIVIFIVVFAASAALASWVLL